MPTIKGLDKTGLETVLDQCAPVKGSVFIHGGGENAAQYFTIKGPVQWSVAIFTVQTVLQEGTNPSSIGIIFNSTYSESGNVEETDSSNLTVTDHDIYYLNENGNNTLMVVKGSDPGSNNGTRLYCMNLDTSVTRSGFTFDIMDFDAINVRNSMFTVFGTGDSSSSEVQFTLNYCIF